MNNLKCYIFYLILIGVTINIKSSIKVVFTVAISI